jgi:MoaA/NifB/PqqE/SkfB family radical SAM enzyme
MAAKLLLEGKEPKVVVRVLERSYRGADSARLKADVDEVAETMWQMVRPGRRFPSLDLDDHRAPDSWRKLSAPLCADVELGDPGTGRAIVDQLCALAVPQVVFVVPHGADPSALVELVEHAEDVGLISGVRARATDVRREGLIDGLAKAGLDHLDLLFASSESAYHDVMLGHGDWANAGRCFEAVKSKEIYAVGVVPLVERHLEDLYTIAATLRGYNVDTAATYALVSTTGGSGALSPDGLPQLASVVEEVAEQSGVNILWAPPVELSPGQHLPHAMQPGPRAVGQGCIRVTASGEVIPAAGPARSAGNLLSGDWAAIWGQDALKPWREGTALAPRCATCTGMATCAIGCPRDPATWARSGGDA